MCKIFIRKSVKYFDDLMSNQVDVEEKCGECANFVNK